MKRKPTFSPSIGSISGLDPAADPIGDLAYELRALLRKCRVDREVRKAHIALLAAVDAVYTPTEDVEHGDNVLAALVEALEHYAPPYTWFGERENDDGETEYGFWPDIRFDGHGGDDTDLAYLKAGDDNRDYWGKDVLLVNDHGNVDCGRFDKRGRWHSYWSCV